MWSQLQWSQSAARVNFDAATACCRSVGGAPRPRPGLPDLPPPGLAESGEPRGAGSPEAGFPRTQHTRTCLKQPTQLRLTRPVSAPHCSRHEPGCRHRARRQRHLAVLPVRRVGLPLRLQAPSVRGRWIMGARLVRGLSCFRKLFGNLIYCRFVL